MDAKIQKVSIEGPSMGPSPNKLTKYLPGQTTKSEEFNLPVKVGSRTYYIQEQHRSRMDEIIQNLDPSHEDNAKVYRVNERGDLGRLLCRGTYKAKFVE